ncbi:hypothetical protein, partial [Rhizobium sp. Root1204]|uniref:hypothetical protein n=1 Tax=Rhizobium sp. Root1204 TaxID=1736428 RepID=UPI001AECE49A
SQTQRRNCSQTSRQSQPHKSEPKKPEPTYIEGALCNPVNPRSRHLDPDIEKGSNITTDL